MQWSKVAASFNVLAHRAQLKWRSLARRKESQSMWKKVRQTKAMIRKSQLTEGTATRAQVYKSDLHVKHAGELWCIRELFTTKQGTALAGLFT